MPDTVSQPESNPYAAPAAVVRDIVDPSHPQLASRMARLGASIVDSIIMLVVFYSIVYATVGFAFMFDPNKLLRTSLVAGLGGLIVFVAINGYWLATRGQTVGKRLLGIKIVRTDGAKATLGRIVGLRYLPFQLAAIVPYVGGLFAIVNVLFIFRESRKCLHDSLADTIVVDAQDNA